MDKVGANFTSVKRQGPSERYPANQMPIGAEDSFGVVDLVKMVAYVYDEDKLGTNWDTVDIPDDQGRSPKAPRSIAGSLS